jgi:hypothetical protein
VFACANGSLVSLRDSLSLNELAVYSAHVGPVNSLVWADDGEREKEMNTHTFDVVLLDYAMTYVIIHTYF